MLQNRTFYFERILVVEKQYFFLMENIRLLANNSITCLSIHIYHYFFNTRKKIIIADNFLAYVKNLIPNHAESVGLFSILSEVFQKD